MTYHDDGFHYQPGGDLTESFHTYGVEWQPNRIVHFVDGQPIQEWTNPRLLAAMGAGAPFYMMFSLDINRIGEADMSIPLGKRWLLIGFDSGNITSNVLLRIPIISGSDPRTMNWRLSRFGRPAGISNLMSIRTTLATGLHRTDSQLAELSPEVSHCRVSGTMVKLSTLTTADHQKCLSMTYQSILNSFIRGIR